MAKYRKAESHSEPFRPTSVINETTIIIIKHDKINTVNIYDIFDK